MARLDAEERKALPDSDFAGPGRTYPIEDKGHAMAAKSEASQHASPGLKSEIDAKVHNRYPGAGKDDPEHKQLKGKLGVPEHEDIPRETMKDAMDGKHGADVQQMAHSVHGRMRAANAQADDGRAGEMDDVFRPQRGQSPMSSGPTAPATPQSPMNNDRYDFGE
jgi:hypothetical protein